MRGFFLTKPKLTGSEISSGGMIGRTSLRKSVISMIDTTLTIVKILIDSNVTGREM